MRKDYRALALANSLDPKRFMKGGSKSEKIPESFAVGYISMKNQEFRLISSRSVPWLRLLVKYETLLLQKTTDTVLDKLSRTSSGTRIWKVMQRGSMAICSGPKWRTDEGEDGRRGPNGNNECMGAVYVLVVSVEGMRMGRADH